MGFQLTDRDQQILNFINEFGFCEMPQIEKRFSVNGKCPWNWQRSYQIMNRLELMGLVKHERVFHGRRGIYRLTAKGAKQTASNLPPLENIPVGNYEHQLAITEVYLKCREHYPEAEWVSERQLLRDKYASGVGKHGHLADGLLVISEKKKIAIEVELHAKNNHRLNKILKEYGTQFDLQEVWYFCTQGLMAVLNGYAEKMPFIKVYDLREFLA